MSRMKVSAKKKESIKSTIIGLTLALSIGMAGTIGSYSYFTDKEEVNNDLIVTTGSLNTSINGDGFNNNVLTPTTSITNTFSIENTGTLKQNAKLYIDNISGEDIGKLNCTIIVTNNIGINIQVFDDSLDRLPKNGIEIGEKIEPGKDKKLKCNVTITPNGDRFSKVGDDAIRFNLYAKGEQINR